MIMKYYKALAKNPYMTDLQTNTIFNINTTYTLHDINNVDNYTLGFSYTDHIAMLANVIESGEYNIFEVIPSGEITYDVNTRKYISTEITIIRQLSEDEVSELLENDLDVLVMDNSWWIRAEVAKYGRHKDLDILVNDDNWTVRAIVATHGRDEDLDILVNDEYWYVRRTVVECGKREKDFIALTNDEISTIRDAVNNHGEFTDRNKVKMLFNIK